MTDPTLSNIAAALDRNALPAHLVSGHVLLEKVFIPAGSKLRLHAPDPVCDPSLAHAMDTLSGTLDDLATARCRQKHTDLALCSTCGSPGTALADLHALLSDCGQLMRRTNRIERCLRPFQSGDVRENLTRPGAPSLLLEARAETEFTGRRGGPPACTDFPDMAPVLHPWWEQAVAGWQQQVRELAAAARAGNEWQAPLVMMTPSHSNTSAFDLNVSYVATTSVGLSQQLACAPYVGDITRQGKRTCPVLCVPAHLVAGTPAHQLNWVNLGSPVTGPDLTSLLAACSAAFSTAPVVGNDFASAVRTSVLHD